MSFQLTTQQVVNREKTVTRRLGWVGLQPGTLLLAVEQSQGLQKGEQVRPLAVIRVTQVTRERLAEIDDQPGDIELEGFGDMETEEFVEMFCRHNKCHPQDWVTRIEFEYVEDHRA